MSHVGTLPAVAMRTVSRSHRSFDPRLVGRLECAAWTAYYRRDWPAFIGAALRVGRHAFGLSWRATIHCSWLVLRANQSWAPAWGNDPERSRRMMERFYRVIQRLCDEPFDPAVAADLEVRWWSVHRDGQRSAAQRHGPALTEALARLYSHVYGVSERAVRPAAEQRALAMRHSDQWVREGCHRDSVLIARERDALIGSYAALLNAIQDPRATSDEHRVGTR